jgi:hypothetical protein
MPPNQKLSPLFVLVIAVIVILVVTSVAQTLTKTHNPALSIVTDSHGFKFGVTPDPLSVDIGKTGTLKLTVWANPPYPDVYFTAYVDGEPLAEGFGIGHNNVVEMQVPIYANDYSYSDQPIYPHGSVVVGKHTFTASVVISSTVNGEKIENPPLEASGTLYIANPAFRSAEDQEFKDASETAVAQYENTRQMVTVKLENCPDNAIVKFFDNEHNLIGLTQTSEGDGYRYIRTNLQDGEYSIELYDFETGKQISPNVPIEANSTVSSEQTLTVREIEVDGAIQVTEAKSWWDQFLEKLQWIFSGAWLR